ncbi:hypothetical protein HaLaN_18684, partial [Haematococcus lacustris]
MSSSSRRLQGMSSSSRRLQGMGSRRRLQGMSSSRRLQGMGSRAWAPATVGGCRAWAAGHEQQQQEVAVHEQQQQEAAGHGQQQEAARHGQQQAVGVWQCMVLVAAGYRGAAAHEQQQHGRVFDYYPA